MKIFEIQETHIQINSNKLLSNDDFNNEVIMYVFTHSGVNQDEIINVCEKLPYDKSKIILDFSLFDFPINFDDFIKIQEISKNFFVISCNWRLSEYDNHAFFDPKIYKFSSEKYPFDSQVKSMSFIFEQNLGYIKPKKFINLTNHIRRERVQLLDKLYSYKTFGYISFPNPNEIKNEVLNYDESFGGWESTKKILENTIFKNDLPLRFDFKKSENSDGETINDVYYLRDNSLKKDKLVNVGLEFNYGMYLSSYLDIFSETFYSKRWEDGVYSNGLIHSSEKTLNPLWAHLPLTCLDSKDKLLYMKKYGFSFESPLHTPMKIDSMYPSDEKTLEFSKFILNILDKDVEEIHDIYLDDYQEFQHNFQIMTTKLTNTFVKQKIKLWLENTYQH